MTDQMMTKGDSTERSNNERVPVFSIERFISGPIPFFQRSNTSMKMREAVSLVRTGACEIKPEELEFGTKLGEGAGGVVFKGLYRSKPCAIKVLKLGFARGTPEYRDLIVELGVLARLGPHPNLVGFLGACVRDMGSPALVLEYVEGTDLEAYLSSLAKEFDLGRAEVHQHENLTNAHHARLILIQAAICRLENGESLMCVASMIALRNRRELQTFLYM